ncbi:MAG: type toxin-antitoxin system PemK/MazF family toxin [Segetibacter sp.]|nr:type toxin-antitoxin system PemK/MazF family toxin [Segetibacter sp.]
MELKQYQIILVNLDPTIGSEIRKTRPCVIISPDEMNRHLRAIVIAPITSTSKAYVTRVEVKQHKAESWIIIDQIRTIDKSRIIQIVGSLHEDEIRRVKRVIQETYVA